MDNEIKDFDIKLRLPYFNNKIFNQGDILTSDYETNELKELLVINNVFTFTNLGYIFLDNAHHQLYVTGISNTNKIVRFHFDISGDLFMRTTKFIRDIVHALKYKPISLELTNYNLPEKHMKFELRYFNDDTKTAFVIDHTFTYININIVNYDIDDGYTFRKTLDSHVKTNEYGYNHQVEENLVNNVNVTNIMNTITFGYNILINNSDNIDIIKAVLPEYQKALNNIANEINKK